MVSNVRIEQLFTIKESINELSKLLIQVVEDGPPLVSYHR